MNENKITSLHEFQTISRSTPVPDNSGFAEEFLLKKKQLEELTAFFNDKENYVKFDNSFEFKVGDFVVVTFYLATKNDGSHSWQPKNIVEWTKLERVTQIEGAFYADFSKTSNYLFAAFNSSRKKLNRSRAMFNDIVGIRSASPEEIKYGKLAKPFYQELAKDELM